MYSFAQEMPPLSKLRILKKLTERRILFFITLGSYLKYLESINVKDTNNFSFTPLFHLINRNLNIS